MTTSCRMWLAVPSLVVGLAGYVSTEQDPRRHDAADKGTQSPKSQPAPATPTPPAQRTLATPVDQRSAKSDPNKENHDFHDVAIAWSAVIQAISAAIMAGFTWNLVRFTKSSWRVSVRNARSARKSADAAKSSADQMETNAEAHNTNATKSARAMERVAASMERNARSIETSLKLTKELVDNTGSGASATADLAGAAQAAANAAVQSANVAARTLYFTQRACLNPIALFFANFGPGLSPEVAVKVTNSGHLPAELLEWSIILLTEDPIPTLGTGASPHFEWKRKSGFVAPVTSGVAPTIVATNITDAVFSDDDWQRIQAGTYALNVYGAIRYSDGFGNIGQTGFGYEYRVGMTYKHVGERFIQTGEFGYNYVAYLEGQHEQGQPKDQP
jgi:hypothetical protein